MIFTPYGTPKRPEDYLAATPFLDFEADAVRAFTADAVGDVADPCEQAVRLFYAVRDRIRYDAFRIRFEPEAFSASTVVEEGAAFCIPKAVLLAGGENSWGGLVLVGYCYGFHIRSKT